MMPLPAVKTTYHYADFLPFGRRCSRLTNRDFTFKVLYLFAITLILISSTIFGSGFSASSVDSNESCENAAVTNISASGFDLNFPASAVLDANPQTLWSTYGKGAWIEMDLGHVKNVCSVDISWYNGDQRWNNFVISTSNDGSSYHKVFESKSSGHTLSFERYNLQDVSARYVKVTVNGNTQNNYASIADITVNSNESNNKSIDRITAAALSENCAEAKISKVTASGTQKNFIPTNAIDKNDKTRWVNEAKNSWIKLDLGKTQTICSLDVQWFKGDTRVYSFTVAVSKDNKKFTDVAKLKSSGKSNGIESYVLKDIDARYLRITVTANTENNFASIVEISIGTKSSSNTPPSSNKCDSNLPVESVTTSGNQAGNPPIGATDNDPNTRWSNQGFDSWITLDLGEKRKICSLNIAWYRGNERINSFDISTSTDGTTFNTVASKQSTGTSSALEKVDISNTQARYVKITVTGNTQNDWISITEIDVVGSALEQPSPPPPSPGDRSPPTVSSISPPNGATGLAVTTSVTATFSEKVQRSTVTSSSFLLKNSAGANIPGTVSLSADDMTATFDPISSLATSTSYTATISPDPNNRIMDPSGNRMATKTWSFTTAAAPSPPPPPPPPPPSPGPGTDEVKQIYQTAPGGETWFFNPDNPDDGQFDPNGADISKNADGSWHLDPGTTRMLAFTKSAGLLSDDARGNLPTYDYSELAQIGHWYKPTDWKNTEMTGYFKVTDTQSGDGISFVTRSVRHNEVCS